jgi:multidrug efflux pump subunit AcrA (membrane-fusion protein)
MSSANSTLSASLGGGIAGAEKADGTGGRPVSAHAVTVGMERGDWVETTGGLEEGEAVVVSGQFLLDSESSLQASLRCLAGRLQGNREIGFAW